MNSPGTMSFLGGIVLEDVPAGIILCGTATAFAKVVDEKRHQLLDRIMGVSSDSEDSSYGYEVEGIDGDGNVYSKEKGRVKE